MRVLVVVDMQNDFIDGALGTKEAVSIVPMVQKKIEEYQDNGLIIFTRDTHNKNYLMTQEGRNLPVEHCIINTKGWEISDQLLVTDCKYIDKPSFGSADLANIIRKETKDEIESIELVGLCTDICVISNAMILKAEFPEVLIKVDAACCAGVTEQSHKNALEAMKMCQIMIIND